MDCLNTTYNSISECITYTGEALQEGCNWSCKTASSTYNRFVSNLSAAKDYFLDICLKISNYVTEFFSNLCKSEEDYVMVESDEVKANAKADAPSDAEMEFEVLDETNKTEF